MKLKNTSLKMIPAGKVYVLTVLTGFVLLCISLSRCGNDSCSGTGNYANDRALIEDLQARYMFALDNGDLDKYVATFTEDGILDIGEGEWQSRDTIKKILEAIPQQEEAPANTKGTVPYRSTGRHNITNIVLKIEGDTAYGRAYWFHMGNNNPERKAILDSYGHYEDVIVKVDGEWLFSKRKIFNEQVAKWTAPEGNPCW